MIFSPTEYTLCILPITESTRSSKRNRNIDTVSEPTPAPQLMVQPRTPVLAEDPGTAEDPNSSEDPGQAEGLGQQMTLSHAAHNHCLLPKNNSSIDIEIRFTYRRLHRSFLEPRRCRMSFVRHSQPLQQLPSAGTNKTRNIRKGKVT